jgi:hypothetical protein
MMENTCPEIIFNLWYVHDERGFIYSLRARAYISSGPESEKLTFLRTYADVDYLIAKPFPIPERFHYSVRIEDSTSQNLKVAHESVFALSDSPIALFEDAIKFLESEIPSQTELQISQSPIVCVTPLMGEEGGKIYPSYDATDRF